MYPVRDYNVKMSDKINGKSKNSKLQPKHCFPYGGDSIHLNNFKFIRFNQSDRERLLHLAAASYL